MPEITQSLPVRGTLPADTDGTILVLSERLDGYDTFLSGKLEVGGSHVAVRILTFDDVTVLRLLDHPTLPLPAQWAGTLHLPHGWRTRSIPNDLNAAALAANRDLAALDEAELRYALTFLGESSSDTIRRARIDAIIAALPALTGLQ